VRTCSLYHIIIVISCINNHRYLHYRKCKQPLAVSISYHNMVLCLCHIIIFISCINTHRYLHYRKCKQLFYMVLCLCHIIIFISCINTHRYLHYRNSKQHYCLWYQTIKRSVQNNTIQIVARFSGFIEWCNMHQYLRSTLPINIHFTLRLDILNFFIYF